MEKQFVAFKVGESYYCIDIMEVQEVIREITITVMPNFPSFVEGVINLRGKIVPLLSIDKKLETIDTMRESDCIKKHTNQAGPLKSIIIKVETITIGLLVDALDKILVAEESQIQNAEGIGKFTNDRMICGILQINNEIYTVLDPKFILENEETEVLTKQLNP
ncbi:MAG: purine-binding chemotaxis protein CheW [Spirochaetota bacterium]|nr:purine-binding chemotaxis protein CheW [Spirochaetota bacterium]